MLLQNKVAVIYGAGGSLGATLANAFAKEGATVYLTGHCLAPLEKVCASIKADGGKAMIAEVDALDEKAVKAHLQTVLKEQEQIHISFNLVGLQDVQDQPLVDMTPEDFSRPIEIAMRTHFITATAAAAVMQQQGQGVILTLTATPGGIGYPKVGGFGPACCAIESFSINLAAETGPYGVRVVNIRSAGSPDSKVFRDFSAMYPQHAAEALGKMKNDTMLKALPLMEDIAQTAIFAASDRAGKITGTTLDLTAGTTNALSYRANKTQAAVLTRP